MPYTKHLDTPVLDKQKEKKSAKHAPTFLIAACATFLFACGKAETASADSIDVDAQGFSELLGEDTAELEHVFESTTAAGQRYRIVVRYDVLATIDVTALESVAETWIKKHDKRHLLVEEQEQAA